MRTKTTLDHRERLRLSVIPTHNLICVGKPTETSRAQYQ